jgi:hypothetical protein
MIDNPIVDEVHRIREQILAEYGGDLHALIEDIRRGTEDAARQGQSIYSPPRREVPSTLPTTKKVG